MEQELKDLKGKAFDMIREAQGLQQRLEILNGSLNNISIEISK